MYKGCVFMRKLMPMDEIVPMIIAVISDGGLFRLYIKGTSMLPLLRQGKDSVMLATPSELRKNDIILYKRSDGSYVLHRIIRIKKDGYLICGDNQFVIERGINSNNVIAKVVSFFRDENEIKLDNEKYLTYIKSLKKRRIKKRLFNYLSLIKNLLKRGIIKL